MYRILLFSDTYRKAEPEMDIILCMPIRSNLHCILKDEFQNVHCDAFGKRMTTSWMLGNTLSLLNDVIILPDWRVGNPSGFCIPRWICYPRPR